MAKEDFFTITINNMKFTGMLSADGPYISANVVGSFGHGVALGHCCDIAFSAADEDGPQGWYICKYSNQKRVHLVNFIESDVKALSDAFNIHIEGRSRKVRPFFVGSPAWNGLVEWVRIHPRIAKRYAQYDSYVSNWYEQAQTAIENPTVAADESASHKL